MYDPPTEENWVKTSRFSEEYKKSYDNGYSAHQADKKENENPHKLSGHERDTTYSDELHYWWYVGYNDYE